MRRAALIALVLLLALPAGALGHATLLKTTPGSSGVVNAPPQTVTLEFSEPVEPRFASVSVTDAPGNQLADGRPTAEGNTLVVPVKALGEGWYLVYWRVVSTDGHPIRGAFTFAVGPNPGPTPEFVIPSISETAATPDLVTARWIVLLAAMAAIGLFVLRLLTARTAGGLRGVTKAFALASAVALVVAPIYLVMSTAQFSLRSPFDFGEVLPALDGTEFGKGFLMLELCFALFVAAAAIAIRLDDPQRPRRTIADLLATTGALLAAAGVLLIPGTSGHPGTAEPRGLAIVLDAVHLGAGSIWLGGLIGLLILWRTKQLALVVRRFSAVALYAVGVLVATGVWASIVHLPTLASLWDTGYGQALLVKIALLVVAVLLAAVNLLRTKTRLLAGQRQPSRFVGGEVVLLAGAVFAAAIVTSLAPPAKAIAEVGKPAAEVGPGPVDKTVKVNGYELTFGITPNRAATQNAVSIAVRKDGRPVTGAAVTESFAMLDMEMGRQEYELTETAPGTYGRETSALVMAGRWGLTVRVVPPGAEPFSVTILDHAGG